MDSITPQQWANTCSHVVKLEETIWESDGLVEDMMEKFVIRVDASESESDDSESSESDCDWAQPL